MQSDSILVNAEPAMNSTLCEMLIDFNEEYDNASDSIRFNRRSGSIDIDDSNLQDGKHDNPIFSTFRGISIDISDDCENAPELIHFNPGVTQTTSIAVHRNVAQPGIQCHENRHIVNQSIFSPFALSD
jgi:hypothetical protein